VHTTAKVHLEPVEGGFGITKIELVCEAEVPGIDAAAFKEQAEAAKKGCPVSKALAATPITLDARLR
jgi:osmotically inducible protein OsmC